MKKELHRVEYGTTPSGKRIIHRTEEYCCPLYWYLPSWGHKWQSGLEYSIPFFQGCYGRGSLLWKPRNGAFVQSPYWSNHLQSIKLYPIQKQYIGFHITNFRQNRPALSQCSHYFKIRLLFYYLRYIFTQKTIIVVSITLIYFIIAPVD